MHLWLLGLPLLIFLSACTPPLTRSQQLAIYRTRCLEYGYEPGTVEFARCMEDQEHKDITLDLKRKELTILEKDLALREKAAQHPKNPLKFKW